MSRKRALKKRADFRKGGFVDRKKFQSGGVETKTLDVDTSDASPVSQAQTD